MQWQYTSSMIKSSAELQRLVNVLTHPNFKTEDLDGFNVEQEKRRLDQFGATGGAFSAEDGWREVSVTLRLPKERCTNIPLTYIAPQGELERRRLKQFYARTNKNMQFPSQVSGEVRRQAIINRIGRSLEGVSVARRKQRPKRTLREKAPGKVKAAKPSQRSSRCKTRNP